MPAQRTTSPDLRHDDHHPSCCGDCTGCTPRPAVRGYQCRRHYEQVERAWNTQARLQPLAGTLRIDSRSIQATSSASTIAGLRVPLFALQLDLDQLQRIDAVDVTTKEGAVVALGWTKAVFAAARYPIEPRTEKLRRTRCQRCKRVTCIVEPPEYAGDRNPVRCMNPGCRFVSTDPDFVEASAHLEIRVDARTRRWVDLQAAIAGDRLEGDDRAGLARVVRSTRTWSGLSSSPRSA